MPDSPPSLQRAYRAVTEGRGGRWVRVLVRFGYATRGVVFTVVGLLAAQVALGLARSAVGTSGAVRQIGQQPYGRTLLAVTTVGLGCYVLWRFAQAAADPLHTDRGASSWLRRIGFFGSGLFYSMLAFTTAQLTLNPGTVARSSEQKEAWTAWALNQPLGSWLVALMGVIIIGAGVQTFYRVGTAYFMQLYPDDRMAENRRVAARRVGRVGLSALGLTLCLIGGFFLYAAWSTDASKAMGIGEALDVLGTAAYGPWIMGTVALGFVCYGAHCFVLARYRQIRAENDDG